MHYIVHAFFDGRTERGEELKEVPKVFQVQYWPWTDYHWPQPMVIARYELVEVFEGELPPKKNKNPLPEKIVAKLREL
jgi:hypothetical protein